MTAIVSDNDVIGHLALLIEIFQSDTWRDLWLELNCRLETFGSLGLARDSRDSEIWHMCQIHQTILITGNRNAMGADSLESTLTAHNTAYSLPVITLANPGRVMTDKQYAFMVAERLLDYLVNIEAYRGVGRLYVP